MVVTNTRTPSRPQRIRNASVLLLVMSAFAALMTACSLTATTTVSLAPVAQGKVSGVIGVESDPSVTTVQVRLTSGTGASVDVRPAGTGGRPADDQFPVTVRDDGAWTSVSPVHPTFISRPPGVLPSQISLRFVMTSPTPVALPIEIRGVNAFGLPTGWARTIDVIGPDCGALTPFTDQTGVDLSGKDLHNCTVPGVTLGAAQLAANFYGADLSGATFTPGSIVAGLSGTRLAGATLANITFPPGSDFTAVDLAGANLAHTDLTGANLRAANLSGTDLSTATLTGVRARRITGTPLLPTGWIVRNAVLVHRTADLRDVDLHGADLHGFDFTGADLTKSTFAGANLSGATFAGAELRGTTLTGANLTGTVLGGAQLVGTVAVDDGVRSGGIIGQPASLPAPWKVVAGYLMGPTAWLSNANLTGVTTGAVDLTNADLSYANLTNTNFAGANLTGLSVYFTTVTGARFANTTVTGLTTGQQVGTPASVPSGWYFRGAALLGPTAHAIATLTGVDLSNLDLHDLDCSLCDLINANLSGTDVHGGALGILDNANLTNADLTGVTIGSEMTGATISGTKLAGVSFNGTLSGGLVGVPASLPTDTTLLDGYLIGPGTRFNEVSFSGKDLRGVSFANTRLFAIDLSGSDLRGVSFRGVFIEGGTLAGAQIDGADFSDSRLEHSLSYGAYPYTDFLGATGTPIYASADLYDVRCPDGTIARDNAGWTCQGHPWP